MKTKKINRKDFDRLCVKTFGYTFDVAEEDSGDRIKTPLQKRITKALKELERRKPALPPKYNGMPIYTEVQLLKYLNRFLI